MADQTVNIHEAKTHLSRLVERVEAGEEVVIARAGRPVARLVPYRARTSPRTPGQWRGLVSIAPDFDRTDDWSDASSRDPVARCPCGPVVACRRPTLDPAARSAITDPVNDVLVSAASIWEIEIKRALGKLVAPVGLVEALDGAGFDVLPITGHDAEHAAPSAAPPRPVRSDARGAGRSSRRRCRQPGRGIRGIRDARHHRLRRSLWNFAMSS